MKRINAGKSGSVSTVLLTAAVAIAAIISMTSAGSAEKKTNSGADSTKAPAAKNFAIRYGYQPGHAQILIADQKGFFAEEFGKDSITLSLSKFASGPALVTAITAGQLDIGQVGDQPAIQAKANNVDIKIIAKYLSSDKVNSLIASKASGIKSIADLKGKKVGVTIGSTAHQLLYIYLASVSLEPKGRK